MPRRTALVAIAIAIHGWALLLLLLLWPHATNAASIPLPSTLAGSPALSRNKPWQQIAAATLGRKPNRKRTIAQKEEEKEEKELTIRRPKRPKRQRRRGSSGRSLWPPWPFNMLQTKPKAGVTDDGYDEAVSRSRRSAPFWVWLFARESTRVTLDTIRQVASQLWFHLPPGVPPFVLVAMVPRKVVKQQSTTEEAMDAATETVKRAIPLFSNGFVRSVALSGLGLAIMSWAHYEIHRKRSLAPLPLVAPYRHLYRIALPPFLPEEIPSSWEQDFMMPQSETEEDQDDEDETLASKSGILPRNVNAILGKAPTPRNLHSTLREWQRMRAQRKYERRRANRLSIQDQLFALQALKSRAVQRKRSPFLRKNKTITGDNDGEEGDDDDDDERLGYALVTGASRGIGRAIAVELARYEIPLILVARDVERLTALAYDLESCYGVRCCIIGADLSKPGEAEKLHKATCSAGLKVDVLVNNAGYSLQGESMDFSVKQTNNLIQLNALSLSTLTHLYGKHMKERGRGRILMVSSICGATAGIPSVAVYAATKSFVNTLSLSIAQELEPYGVGVTCVMPGAVKDTEFKSRSDTDQALCWKIPFYPKTPQRVAESGVKALLRGETECTPGWENRFFLKVLKPAVPQRIHNIIAEIFWNPLQWPFTGRTVLAPVAKKKVVVDQEQNRNDSSPPRLAVPKPQRIPRLLKLEDETVERIPEKNNREDDENDEEPEGEEWEEELDKVSVDDELIDESESNFELTQEENENSPEPHFGKEKEEAHSESSLAAQASFGPLAFLHRTESPARESATTLSPTAQEPVGKTETFP